MTKINAALTLIHSPFIFFLILALGVFSITRLITTDTFPPILALRNWIFERFPHDGYTSRKRPNPKRAKFIVTGDHYYVNEGHWFGELISCNWCAGWWTSLVAAASFVLFPTVTLIVLLPFALRVIPGMIASIID